MADIGTDHALVPTYLRFHGRVPNAIASDLRQGPLDAAACTLQRWNIRGVDLRRGSGLEVLRPAEVETAVIAGMGGHTIRRMLDRSPAAVASLDSLVLQPNTEWSATRSLILERGWTLADESLVEDSGIYYVVLRVLPRSTAVPLAWSELDLELGPHLRERGGPVFQAYLHHRIVGIDRALAELARANDGHPAVRELELRRATLEDELRRCSQSVVKVARTETPSSEVPGD